MKLALAESGEKRLKSNKVRKLALYYAKEALKLATCDGPPYYYKVAYEEAERLIARLTSMTS